jgi:acyl-CoA synthetase (AMP-forming)/AMP-acid ligase II
MDKIRQQGFTDWIGRWALYSPDRVMLELDGSDRRWTYARADNLVGRLAGWLSVRGVVAGRRVAVLSQNEPEYIFLFFALQRIGAILVPMNFRLAAPEIRYVLDDASPSLLIYQKSYAEVVGTAGLPSGCTLVTFESMVESLYADELPRPETVAGIATGMPKLNVDHQNADELPRPETVAGIATGTSVQKPPDVTGLAESGKVSDDIHGADVVGTNTAGRQPATSETAFDVTHLNPEHGFDLDASMQEVCMILYTSGTTGRPKGAMITNAMLFWNSVNTGLRLNLTQNDTTLVFAPFFHTGGWNVLTTPFIHRGARLIMLRKFDSDRVLQVCDQQGVTILFGVPTMMDIMYRSQAFAGARLAELRYAIVGGEPMPLPLIETWQQKGVPIRQGYGLTEFGPNVFSLNEEDAIRKIGSIGFPNFYIEARVLDDDGRELGAGEQGELVLRGPVCMKGYWNNPQATAATIRDGWLYTGDIVRRDSEGYYYVVDRKKDMYISGAENVYPAEVEHVLRTHHAVREAAVIGIPDPKWGESGLAFVVLSEGYAGVNPGDAARTVTSDNQITSNEIIEHCTGRLAKYKIPSHVRFIEALPKSDSGKILKRQLRELLPDDA